VAGAIESAPLTGEKAKWLVATLVATILGVALLVACGGSTSGSDQFRDQSDSGLLDFGEESGEAEREEAAEVVHGFYSARARKDWSATCAQLSRGVLAKIEHLATSATDLKDTSCPSFLKAFTRLSRQEQRESTVVDAGSLRQQGPKGFLIYYGAGKVVYTMPLREEDGSWKVDSLSSKLLD
jgi:hypothetical protein